MKLKKALKEWSEIMETFIISFFIMMLVDFPIIFGIILITLSIIEEKTVSLGGLMVLLIGVFMRTLLRRFGKQFLI